jgi:carbon monoxide dehydrogenase subunit G
VSAVTVQRTIDAPIERVWRTATDLRNMHENLTAVDAVEILTPGPFDVGTTWRETRTMRGRQATEEMTVTACEAPRRYVVEAQSRGARYRSEFTFEEPAAGLTVVTMTFDANADGTVARLMNKTLGGVMARAVGKVLAKDLDDLARVCESNP